MEIERRVSKVDDDSNFNGYTRCLYFLEVVKSKTYRTSYESGRRWCSRVLTVD